ncbi:MULTISPECIES: hypothetical protein [Chryseobacterium]|uniref:TonB-linked outer membrane protein, SusC/RagA family n=1 Tax=Chryseobacterium indoltheticum TaxID=254 RepID=A0A376C352_9FLAO|nr:MULTISPECIES: hypothetical protein [Chryseobacterium]STA63135.1 Uncharacterised protein [Chryseobacterium indoltheticum]
MKYLFFLFFSVSMFSQNIVTGKTFSEQGYILKNVLIININTNEKTTSNNEGFFSIKVLRAVAGICSMFGM